MQLRYILEEGLDDFQKCFIDSTAVEANTERPTESMILVRLIERICTAGGKLHRLDLPDMNQIGLLEQQEELRGLSQEIRFIRGKAQGEAKRKKCYFQLLRRVRRLRKRLLRDLETVRRNLESRSRSAAESATGGRRRAGAHRGGSGSSGTRRRRCERRIMDGGESADRRKDDQPERLRRGFYR